MRQREAGRAYTPGPWEAVDLRHQRNGQIRIFGDCRLLANVLASNPRALPDAALIAESPALLSSLCELLRVVRMGAVPPGTLAYADYLEALSRATDRAQRVIDRATLTALSASPPPATQGDDR